MKWDQIGKKAAAILLSVVLAFFQPVAYAGASHMPSELSDIQSIDEETEDQNSSEENEVLIEPDENATELDYLNEMEPDSEDSVPSNQTDDRWEQLSPESKLEPDEHTVFEDGAEDIAARPKSDDPYYEIAPDLEYGAITIFNSGLGMARASKTRKISELKVNDTVMIPLADGKTLKFRVMVKDHYKFDKGVVLMSTQYVAMVTYKCGDTARGAGKFSMAGGGSYYDSILREYLNTSFYNELHPNVKQKMKKASQGEEYYTDSYQKGVNRKYDYFSYSDLVFMPSTYEVNKNTSASHNYFGQSWGADTNFAISNQNNFNLRDRMAADYTMHNGLNKDTKNCFLHTYYVLDTGTTNFTYIGNVAWANNMVSEPAVPCILLDNNTLIFDGKSGAEIHINSPPTTPGAVSAPATVYKHQSSTVNYSWGKSTDPDDDAITYVLEYAVNGSDKYTQATTVSGTSYSLTIPASNPGSIRFRVKARDAQGAESAYSYSGWTTIVYNSPPTTPTGMNGAAFVNSWIQPNAAFSWKESTDPDGDPITYAVEKSVNGGEYVSVQNTAETSFSHPISIPGDNSVQIRVKAFDGKAYSDYCYSVVTAIIHDTDAPTIQLMSSPDATGGWVRGEITLTAILTDALSGLKTLFVPDGVSPEGNQTLSGQSATKSFKTTVNGIYPFTVSDNAGNSASATIEIPMVDNIPPTLEYSTSTPEGEFTNTDVIINMTIADTLSGLAEYINPNASEDVSGKIAQRTFTVSANGVYPFTVIDVVGNIFSKNIRINMIDRIKPVITINPHVTKWTNADSVTMDIYASDDYSGIQKIILPDGLEYIGGTETACTIYENGVYSTTTTDSAGNVSDVATVNYQWFDRTPPTITSLRFVPVESLIRRFISLFGNIVSNKSIQMELTYDDTPIGTDSESGVKWIYHRVFRNDGELVEDWTATSAGASSPRIDGEINGYVEVVVEDAAGNRSDMATFEILIDKTPPEAYYTVSETKITNQPVIATLTASDEAGGSGFKGWLLPDGGVLVSQPQLDYTYTENATKTFVALDSAGNRTEVVIAVGNIDLFPPVITGIDVEEVNEGGFLRAIANLFGKTAFNTKIRVTVNAADDIAIDRIFYTVTPDEDIPDNTEWLVMDDSSIEFEQEMSGVFHARAIDLASNWSNVMSRKIMIDSTPPDINRIESDITGENLHDIPKLALGVKDSINDGAVFTVDASDNFGVDKILYCLTERSDIPNKAQWQESQNGTFRLMPNLNGCLHIKAVDFAGNESRTISKEILLDTKPPVIEDILFERAGGGLFSGIKPFSGIISSELINATVIASDNFGIDRLLYCVTPDAGLPENAGWLKMPSGKVHFDAEINGVIHVKAVDLAGNESAIVSLPIIVDITPPVINHVRIENTGENLLNLPKLALGINDNINEGAIFTVESNDNFGVDSVVYCVTEHPDITFKAQWQEAQDGTIRLQAKLNPHTNFCGYIHIKAIDIAHNESDVISKEILLDSEPPVIENVLFEKAGGGLFAGIKNLFGFTSNVGIKATLTASDNFGTAKLLYCVTSGADIHDDVVWLAMDGNSVEFEQEMAGLFHVKAVDKARNESETVSRAIIIDSSPPNLLYEISDRENEYEQVTIQVTATDNSSAFGMSGISHITNPLGDTIQGGYMEYTADRNGSYTFTAADHAGNTTSLTVEIDSIVEIMITDFEGNRPVIDAALHATGKRTIGDVSYSDLLNITYLDMSAKGLVSVPEILRLAKNITHLDLRGNELREVPEFVYSLYELKSLDLSNNNLDSIDSRITTLRNLETLDVSLNYLVDYDCPLIVPNYRDAGNYSVKGRDGQYSFTFSEPESVKEYAGNTATLTVDWSYGGQPVESGFENHRKIIYRASHNDYRSYRPAIHEYMVENGQIKHSNADYVQIYTPDYGIMSASIIMGGLSALSAASESVDVLGLPEPEISGFDVANGIVFVRAAGLDTEIKADIRAVVSALNEDGGVLETSEVRVNDPDNIKIPLKTKLQKDQIVTAVLINHNIKGSEIESLNESDGNTGDTGSGGRSGSGNSKTVVEYIVTEAAPNEVIIEKIVEVEAGHIGSAAAANGSGCDQDGSKTGLNNGEDGTAGQNADESGSGQPVGASNVDDMTEKDAHDNDSVQSLYTKVLAPIQIPLIFIPMLAALPLFGLILPHRKRKRGDEDEKH